MANAVAPAARTPYRLICWNGAFVTLGAFGTFPEALRAHAASAALGKALVNDDHVDHERSGLTEDELDAVYTLPANGVATDAQLAAALACVQVAA